MMEVRKVEVRDVLRARDARAERQKMLLARHQRPLVSFTMNIAGEIKRDEEIERAFFEGVRRVERQLGWHGVAPNDEQYAQAIAELKAQFID